MTANTPDELYYYLSGPMSGIENYNFDTFEAAYVDLRERGYVVCSPHTLVVMPDWEWTQYMRRDLRLMLNTCNAIILLPGWEKSKGARLEAYVADSIGWKMFLYQSRRLDPLASLHYKALLERHAKFGTEKLP